MKRFGLIVVLAVVALTSGAAAPPPAVAAPCGFPNAHPLWIDFAGGGAVPFWETFAQPGVVVAASNFIFPPQIRARGARTVYWDMYLVKRAGTPSEPLDPATIESRADRFYNYAAESSACDKPIIAENELAGAWVATPWSPSNAQYRANVLNWLRALAARGARPALLISSAPYTGGEAAEWWRQVAKVSDIVREAYFPAPAIYAQGPVAGSRSLRVMFRKAAADLLAIGIPPSRIGIMLGFHTTPGWGGRERLRPARAWFEVVKLQTFAANQVAHELRLGSVWSWGWGAWKTLPGEYDPDKPAAACVYLWARNPRLCDGPAAAGPGFDASRIEGQLGLPRGTRCTVGTRQLRDDSVAGIRALVGDEQAAFTAAYARAVAARKADVDTRKVLAAERALVAMRFGGSRSAYRAALSKAHATVEIARGVILDELIRDQLSSRMRVARPSATEIDSYYSTYANASARLVDASPAPSWLGGKKRGFALSSLAPPQIFGIPAGRQITVRTATGTFKVRALGDTLPLGAVPLEKVRPAIRAALAASERREAYDRWLLVRENEALRVSTCWRDQLPSLGVVSLIDYMPFLALDGGAAGSPRTSEPTGRHA